MSSFTGSLEPALESLGPTAGAGAVAVLSCNCPAGAGEPAADPGAARLAAVWASTLDFGFAGATAAAGFAAADPAFDAWNARSVTTGRGLSCHTSQTIHPTATSISDAVTYQNDSESWRCLTGRSCCANAPPRPAWPAAGAALRSSRSCSILLIRLI